MVFEQYSRPFTTGGSLPPVQSNLIDGSTYRYVASSTKRHRNVDLDEVERRRRDTEQALQRSRASGQTTRSDVSRSMIIKSPENT